MYFCCIVPCSCSAVCTYRYHVNQFVMMTMTLTMNLRMKFSAQNVNFSSLKFWPLTFKEFSLRGRQMGTPIQNVLLFYCMLYINSPGGSTDAVARHVSFAQTTCRPTSTR